MNISPAEICVWCGLMSWCGVVSGTAFGVDEMQRGKEVVVMDIDRGKVFLGSL